MNKILCEMVVISNLFRSLFPNYPLINPNLFLFSFFFSPCHHPLSIPQSKKPISSFFLFSVKPSNRTLSSSFFFFSISTMHPTASQNTQQPKNHSTHQQHPLHHFIFSILFSMLNTQSVATFFDEPESSLPALSSLDHDHDPSSSQAVLKERNQIGFI